MTNGIQHLIIASDDEDLELGLYFSKSAHQLITNVGEKFNIIHLSGDCCADTDLDSSISGLDGQVFVLAAFSHGSSDALVSTVSQSGYLHAGNAYLLSNSIVYANSCLAGLNLRNHLISQGCVGFVGYSDEIYVLDNLVHNEQLIYCENFALVHYLNSDATLSRCVELMREKYDEFLEQLLADSQYMAASHLLHNVNCLVVHDPEL